MIKKEKFRISSYLKDIIGRDLVTNEYVAIFELVKNSFDAGATSVDIEFHPDKNTIAIIDNGHGMSENDIRNKWLFVAHSEKAPKGGLNYRDLIKTTGQFAGSKGIGRFSCDTLGSYLTLYSRTDDKSLISKLDIDWAHFEDNSTNEFQEIDVEISSATQLPDFISTSLSSSGTVLLIQKTRHNWDHQSINRLRRDLAKLIDPFGTTNNVTVSTWLIDNESKSADINGPVANDISDIIEYTTSKIEVKISEGYILTTLYDRGRKIYSISEKSHYEDLDDCEINGKIYYLNTAAKSNFTKKMGVRPVQFGSIFLFLNGFRISPIGDETDDTFGLNRRKQQGQSRYLGTRDVLGRIDVLAPPRMFREVSSRNGGLIEDARSRSLYKAIMQHMIIRLERYVVGVNWQDKLDQNRVTPEGLDTDSTRARILDVIGGIARSQQINILYYDEKITELVDDPESATKASLEALTSIAEKSGNSYLLNQIKLTKNRIIELQSSREEALLIAKRAQQERINADSKIAALERQAEFLGSSRDVDIERTQLLMHQATIHIGHLRAAVKNASVEARLALEIANQDIDDQSSEEFEDILVSARQSLRRLSGSLASANLSADRLSTVISFAPNIKLNLETDHVVGDLFKFFSEYFQVRLDGVSDMPAAKFNNDGIIFVREFSPVDIAVIIDNLMDNARKAKATKVEFTALRKGSNSIIIHVEDDGLGIDPRKIDPSKIFERGYTSMAEGTGLGLYSVKQIIEGMAGKIEHRGDISRADFEITLSGEVK